MRREGEGGCCVIFSDFLDLKYKLSINCENSGELEKADVFQICYKNEST